MENKRTPEISLIIPVFNEVSMINEVAIAAQAAMDSIRLPNEIIVVNDGSTDGTGDALRDIPFVRVITHPYNKGNGASVKTGIRAALGHTLVLMDGDGQHDPKDLPQLLEEGRDYDLIVGSRHGEGAHNTARRLANRFFNWLASYVSGRPIMDLTSGFRVVNKEKMTLFLPLLPNGFSYPTTSTLAFIKSGFSVAFVPVEMKKRTGKSKISPLRDGVHFLLIIAKITVLFSPLKVFTPVSIFSIALGILHGFYKIVFLQMRYSNLSVLFVTTGLLIFFIGLVSEQIAMLRFENINEARHSFKP